MVDHEMKLNQIRAKNEENIQKQKDKEARMREEIDRKRKLQEAKKA
jgi:hypothetical protein